jgi:hypothetical protein
VPVLGVDGVGVPAPDDDPEDGEGDEPLEPGVGEPVGDEPEPPVLEVVPLVPVPEPVGGEPPPAPVPVLGEPLPPFAPVAPSGALLGSLPPEPPVASAPPLEAAPALAAPPLASWAGDVERPVRTTVFEAELVLRRPGLAAVEAGGAFGAVAAALPAVFAVTAGATATLCEEDV